MKFTTGDRVEVIGSKTYGPHNLAIGTQGTLIWWTGNFWQMTTDTGKKVDIIEKDLKLISMKPQISYKFPDGAIITGSADQILSYAKATDQIVDGRKLGPSIPKGYYNSSTKGLIEIKTMDTFHIINSLNKRTVDYFTALKPEKGINLNDYLKKYVSLTETPEVEDLYKELVIRSKS